MRIVALQAAVRTGKNPLVASFQRRGINLMAISAKGAAVGLEQVGPVRGIGGMAGIALPLSGRFMGDAVLPVTIYLVAAQAESRLFLQQVGGFVVAVRRVTGIAVETRGRLMGMFGGRNPLQLIVAAQTDRIAVIRQQGRLVTGVGLMTGLTRPFPERLVPDRLLALQVLLLVATGAKVGTFGKQQSGDLSAMRLVTT